MENIRIKLKRLHQDIQDKGGMDLRIPLVMRIVVLFIGGWNLSCVSLGPRILILISIRWQFILKISLALEG
jgi:hypothetical protein